RGAVRAAYGAPAHLRPRHRSAAYARKPLSLDDRAGHSARHPMAQALTGVSARGATAPLHRIFRIIRVAQDAVASPIPLRVFAVSRFLVLFGHTAPSLGRCSVYVLVQA